MATTNANMIAARKNKNDEFYTQRKDIDNELQHCEQHFNGKTVYLNCDDPSKSNFFFYFSDNFNRLGLKKLLVTHYNPEGSTLTTVTKDGVTTVPLEGDGDFRSDECVTTLQEADFVITNPPFSLFRDFVDLMYEHDKKFLIIGTTMAMTYKNVIPRVLNGDIWLGVNAHKTMYFELPDYYEDFSKEVDGKKLGRVSNITWYTRLEASVKRPGVKLKETYCPTLHPSYDGCEDVIEVCPVKLIPSDYDGVMAVPITYLPKHDPDQFDLVGFHYGSSKGYTIQGKTKHCRLHIRRKG